MYLGPYPQNMHKNDDFKAYFNTPKQSHNNEQISEVGQPDAERQSCVLTSAYSCLALKNHPTFGVEKHHVEIGKTAAFLRAEMKGKWELTWFYSLDSHLDFRNVIDWTQLVW